MSSRKTKQQDDKFRLLLSMLIFQDDELFADLSDLQRKKKEGLITEEIVNDGVKRITEKIMAKLAGN